MNVIKGRLTSTPLPETTAEARAVMDAYASLHGLDYAPYADEPIFKGSPFYYGKLLGVGNVFRGRTGRQMEFGNFTYAWPLQGDNALIYSWDFAYLAIKLDRKLPQISLQAKGSPVLWDTTQGLPIGPSLTQLFKLEGDFNKYFYFYCPEGYETDALYIFTPDVMALFIDEAAPFDAEIVEDWLLIYSRYPFRAGDTSIYDRLLRIVDLIGSKVAHQTDGYRDDRVGNFAANVVTPRGRRLARGVPNRVWVILGAVIALPFLGFIIEAIIVIGFNVGLGELASK